MKTVLVVVHFGDNFDFVDKKQNAGRIINLFDVFFGIKTSLQLSSGNGSFIDISDSEEFNDRLKDATAIAVNGRLK